MTKCGDLMMILDLHRQGLKVAVIARQMGIDRKTVRKYIARGIELPTYGPRLRIPGLSRAAFRFDRARESEAMARSIPRIVRAAFRDDRAQFPVA